MLMLSYIENAVLKTRPYAQIKQDTSHYIHLVNKDKHFENRALQVHYIFILSLLIPVVRVQLITKFMLVI